MPQVGWRADSWVWTLRSPTHGVARYLAAKGMLGVFHAGTKAGSASAWNWMNQNRAKSQQILKIVLQPQKFTWNLKMDPCNLRFPVGNHHFQVSC